ncbi:hypothetical protein BO94DRAFT_133787 [Aspergillus sclerotioniger CBS 115572]|uniref:Uncharacterized protein n=1 Tax=Aspergillus sclerotioniger CBS 115572 TaxID=1450535 RepID=A0A317XBC4_9EURO|nr:hypothetical protein BO94DRAFT_133787 [Aspergillus sclerotioniger CBS 115572]PWY95695.1 hypothetical protein BO94DRAFT_133787 [Aspergillus sclerotioniger CBS 115572]
MHPLAMEKQDRRCLVIGGHGISSRHVIKILQQARMGNKREAVHTYACHHRHHHHTTVFPPPKQIDHQPWNKKPTTTKPEPSVEAKVPRKVEEAAEPNPFALCDNRSRPNGYSIHPSSIHNPCGELSSQVGEGRNNQPTQIAFISF